MSPDKLVEKSIQEVMGIIKQDEAIKSGDKNRIYGLVNDKILPHFNFNRMTKLAMGKNWKKATPEQQDELVNAFRTLLVRTYSNALSNYQDEVVKVTPIKNLGSNTDSTVKTTVIQGNSKAPVPINYSMQKTDGNWKIYDVTVSGVSLVTNYRGSFNSKIRKQGVEGLINALNKKNKSLQNK
ncbi:MAG: ABC transporter substrate-binding protein [Gammaproteobacteria bacterium]|nr:ABC transporter substrate-binding protein [Gammaproteobacteria bacterium]